MANRSRAFGRWFAGQTAWEVLKWAVIAKVAVVTSVVSGVIAWLLRRPVEWIILLTLVGFAVGAVLVAAYAVYKRQGIVPAVAQQRPQEFGKVEPLRVVFRLAGNQACGHVDSVLEHIISRLRASGVGMPFNYGRLLELARRSLDHIRTRMREELEQPTATLDAAQQVWLTFIEGYEETVLWMRDAGIDAQFEFDQDGNYRLWKQFDGDLRRRLREVSGMSEYPLLGKKLLGRVEVSRDYWA